MRLALNTISPFLLIYLLMMTPLSVTAEEEYQLLEPADTSNPRATLLSFIDSCNQLYELAKTEKKTNKIKSRALSLIEQTLDCLDLSKLPRELRDSIGLESAIYLKEVLDRVELPEINKIPGAEVVAINEKNNSSTRWRVPHTRLIISRVESGPRQGEYLFSPETVRSANSYYSIAKQIPYQKNNKVTAGFYDLYVAVNREHPMLSASDTSSPRDTLTLFLDSLNDLYTIIKNEENFNRNNKQYAPLAERILSCLDLSQLPEFSREYHAGEAAVCIKEILDRTSLPATEDIPGAESLIGTEGKQLLLSWQIPKTQLSISRIEEGPRRGEYLFTPNTVKRAPEYYEKIKHRPYKEDGRVITKGIHDWWLSSPGHPAIAAIVDWSPHWIKGRYMGLAVWQWVGLVITFLIGAGIIFLAIQFGRTQGEAFRQANLVRYWITLFFPIAVMLVPVVIKKIAIEFLTIRGTALYTIGFISDIVFLLSVMFVIVGGSNRIAESIVALPHIRPQGLDAHLIRIISRVIGLGAAVLVFLEGGRYLGFPLTTLLASAGIGGLAIALAAQGMIKGLFGTVTILFDKPFRVGERIVVNGHDGMVEEIGLRSTKIRTLTNHLVSIPNDQMADSEIENIGRRKYIRRTTDLHIPLDTSREKLELAVSLVRGILENHEGMDADFPPRVFFREFEEDAFNIRLIYWYQPPNVWDYFAFSEKVNFEIFRAFEDQGIKFSLPLRHSYWKNENQQGAIDVNVGS